MRPSLRLCLLFALMPLAGCSHDVTLKNPTTGTVATCRAGALGEINPWSQQDMCVEQHVSEGWLRQ